MSLQFSLLGKRQTESDIARLMTIAIERPDLLSLAAGFTDNETLPLEEVTELAGALGREGMRSALQYGSNQGSAGLREALTGRLAEQDKVAGGKGDSIDSGLSFIANGSQQALYLAVQTLCDPGDIVLVERPTYFVFMEMLRGLGVEARSLPMLPNGEVDVVGLANMLEAIEKEGALDRVKAVYLVSYFANPTGHSVSRSSKQAIIDLLGGYRGRIGLLEDAAYRELYFEMPAPAPSCIGLGGGAASVPVFYTTTLTKSFASGLKVGYAYCTHRDWLGRMLAVKGQQDFGTAHYVQALLSRAIVTGAFERRLAILRSTYQRKMRLLDDGLRERLEGLGWRWMSPAGGLYLWLVAPEGVATGFESSFHESCLNEGVMYVPGSLCFAGEPQDGTIRLSFGALPDDKLREAGRRFAAAAANHM